MEQPGGAASLSDFLCTEDRTCLDARGRRPAEPCSAASLSAMDGCEEEGEEEESVVFLNDSALSDTEEYIGILVSRESAFRSVAAAPPVRRRLVEMRPVRRRPARGRLRFSLHSAYVSVTYLDRFLLRRTMTCQPWVMQLLSVACLSLAAKMEEIRVPPLPEFPSGDYQFDSRAIQRMELLVLNTLEWRMSPITPFVYLSFFAIKLAGDVAAGEKLFYRAVGFIFSTIEGMNLGDFRASAVAAAAIFAASGKVPTETSMQVISTSGSPPIGQVFACYKTMIQESRSSQSGPGPHGADMGCKRRRDGAD
ncbi:unnamed protein product [Spirodela intermedia]|uniref:Cyclin-like domain-containing protein n=1 Tax=Spirodela intermedia TaxID=51605 RepID=A0A7I8JBR6_SPIIN|nr:unnamed protein product [Spirodela intermedia]CAA6667411.1 unnamed protein product [Spirodela intermedia]